ncbi:hypothetical protein [Alkaliphilus sp. B6464]|uniref:hypothetical protein n=1 Tax=Alkaliphilus sp. B6464 TaxID=2731219 RepID=UPI001BAB9BE5|nr:hypothetical protein [Alkaliphilus sp. B6464]QUH21942.1 hypothetical protein HYG84_18725 [Alkaliphilus sp. B6464]
MPEKIYEVQEYIIPTDNGKERKIKMTAGNVIRVNADNGFLSFDIAVNKARDKDPTYINRINVTHDGTKKLVEKFQPGQQIFVVWAEVESDKEDKDGNPYVNKYLERFWYGRFPQMKDQ